METQRSCHLRRSRLDATSTSPRLRRSFFANFLQSAEFHQAAVLQETDWHALDLHPGHNVRRYSYLSQSLLHLTFKTNDGANPHQEGGCGPRIRRHGSTLGTPNLPHKQVLPFLKHSPAITSSCEEFIVDTTSAEMAARFGLQARDHGRRHKVDPNYGLCQSQSAPSPSGCARLLATGQRR